MKTNYETPEAEEIKISLENNFAESRPGEGGGEGYGDPEQD